MSLEPVHTLRQVADARGVTVRFLRAFVNDHKIEHLRIGNGPNARIKFTEAQIAALDQWFVQDAKPLEQSITTGRRRRAS